MKRRFIGKMAAAVLAVCGIILIQGATVQAQQGITVVGNDNNTYYCTNGKLNTDYNGMATDLNGKKYWFDYGVMAQDKQVYDFDSEAWYWFDADGTMAVDKDVYIPLSNEDREHGKWVRYDKNGGMVKGEDYRYGGWYYFDNITGEMIKGFTNIPDGTDNGKWVYYDIINGQMHHGESCIDGGWYRFDDITGKMVHGEYCTYDGKWYLYDNITGIMQKGNIYNNGNMYYYDEVTGIMQKGTVYHDGEWHYYDELTGILIVSGDDAAPDEGYFINMAKECLDLQNQVRAEAGVAALAWDEELYQDIKIRGPEIAESFSHTRPNGSSCFSVVTLQYRTLGENIAAGYYSAEAVTNGWYNSQGHRENMLNSSFTSAAVVCYKVKGSEYTWYWVTMFRG